MNRRNRKLLALLLTLAMLCGTALSAVGETVTELPRSETLYFAGQQWGPVTGWNPLSDSMNNAMAITQGAGGSRTTMFETLYMYNMLDGSMTPLLADGDYTWNDARTEITCKIIRQGFKIHEVPISYAPREEKKLSPWRDGWPAVRVLWRLRKWKPGE